MHEFRQFKMYDPAFEISFVSSTCNIKCGRGQFHFLIIINNKIGNSMENKLLNDCQVTFIII